jgi:hypothetical protein
MEKGHPVRLNGVKAELKPKTKVANKARKMYCSCRQPDDGSPMILCAECKEWCVGISSFPLVLVD